MSLCIGKGDADGSTFTGLTGKINFGTMVGGCVLYDRESQTGAAGLFGVALVYAVKALKDVGMVLRWDADTGVSNGQGDTLIVPIDLYGNGAAFHVVANGVVAQVIQKLI